jgi:hypothetical protein
MMEINDVPASVVAGCWQATIDEPEVKKPSARLIDRGRKS